VEILLHYDDVGPDAIQKLVLADGSSVGFEQNQEQIKGACVKLDRHSIGQQLPLPWHYPKPAKLESNIGFDQTCIEHRSGHIGATMGSQGREL
jgi:hypothetical protein